MVSWFFFFPPLRLGFWTAGPEETKNLAGKCPPPDSDPFSDVEFGKISSGCQASSRQNGESPFPIPKRGQLVIRTPNETLSVVAVRVSNKDCSPLRING